MQITKRGCLTVVFLMTLCIPALQAQPSGAVATAPVPEQIVRAKKVFISNAGMDAISMMAFRRLGDPDRPYNLFYAAMKTWGHYELAASPADADLVFEIRFSAPLIDVEPAAYGPQVGLVILDARTHFILWTMAEPVQGAVRKGTFVKNVNSGITNLMADVKKLASQAADLTRK